PVDRDVAEALGHPRRRAVEKGDRIGRSEESFPTRGHFADDELPEPEGKRSDGRIVRFQEFGECPLRVFTRFSLSRLRAAYGGQACPSRPSCRSCLHLFPVFSYHFRFAVAVPMQTMSTRLSALRSAAAHPAPAIPPSSMTRFDQLAPSAD